MNGLVRRVEVLETRVVSSPDPYLGSDRETSVQRLSDLAERLHGTPSPALNLQSPAERVVRAGLAAMEASDDPAERGRLFWSTVSQGLRDYDRERRS